MRARRNGTMVGERPRRGVFGRRRKLEPGLIEGVVRVDARTKHLLHRLKPGEVAVILHEDLDQVSAEGLVDRGAAAVVNCHRSITGRYPNAGPAVLARAGIPLIDAVGEGMLDHVKEGDVVRVEGTVIVKNNEAVGEGILLQGDALDAALEQAKAAMGESLGNFVRNTMEYLNVERDLVLNGEGVPTLRTKIAGRPVLVIVRGHEYKADLQILRGFIRETKPVLIAVDGGADALLEEGIKPHVIVGDMDSVSTGALTCGAELVVHAYPDGHAPGLPRIEGLGLDAHIVRSAGTSEDVALLLAYEEGADLIVAVGAHDNMVEFLEKGRGGMASTFVVRLKVGPKLVDAKRVNRLYRSSIRTRDVFLLVAGMFGAWVATFFASPAMRLFVRGTVDSVRDFFHALVS